MNAIAIFFILSGLLLSIFVYLDTRKHKQSMPIMSVVWSLTMLWASWIGLLAYISFGRQKNTPKPMVINHNNMNMEHSDSMVMNHTKTRRQKWEGIAMSTLHCGAGCVLADIIGESISGKLGLSISVGWILDYLIALVIGVYFQYVAIQQMRRVKPSMAINRALKSDFLSLTSWQIGMYSFMGVYFLYFAESDISRLSLEFWFVMQLSMFVGFLFSYPMNIILIKIGLKHSM